MWNLHILDRDSARDWQAAGTFATLNEAATEIIRQEGMPVNSLFLQMNVETSFGKDEEFLSLFLYDGKKFSYTIKKSLQ